MNNLQILAHLVCFAESENLVHTAQKLGLTQPALTAQFKKLEEELGQAVFRQEGKRKVLNSFGQSLVESISRPLEEVRQAVVSSQLKYLNEVDAVLRVGGRRELIQKWVSQRSFQGTIELVAGAGQESLKLLAQNRLDLVITQREGAVDYLMRKKYFTDSSCLIVSRKTLKEKPHLNQFPFFEWPVVAYNRDFPLIADYMKEKTSSLKCSFYCDHWNEVIQWVAQKRVWSIVPKNLLDKDHNFHVYDLKSLPRPTFYFYYHQDMIGIPWFRELLGESS